MPTTERVLDDLEEAADARIIAEAPGGDLAYLFTHDLVREAVCDQVKTARRMRGCMRILPACWNAFIRAGRSSTIWLSWRGTFVAAGRAGDPDKAIDYSVRAGRRSLEQLAYEEAARHFGLPSRYSKVRTPAVDQSRLCELLQDLGEAQKRAGQFASLATFQRAFEVARHRRRRPDGPGGHCFRMADLEHQQAGCEQRASVQRSAPRTAGRSTSLASETFGRPSQGAQGPGLRGASRRIRSRGGRTRTAGGGAVDSLLCAGVGAPHELRPRTSASGFPMPSNASKRRERRATWRR